jgi:hypothetical protein
LQHNKLTTMKKNVFLAVLALLAFKATAQLTFTPRIGLNFANAAYSSDEGVTPVTKIRTGFLVSANLDYSINKMWSIGAGLAYSQKGQRFELTTPAFPPFIPAQTLKSNTLHNYLEIPIMANAHFGNEDGVMFNVGAGPYIGLALGGTNKTESDGQSTTEDAKVGNGEDDDLAPLDFGINIGAGLTYKRINFGVQYGLGLSSIIPSGAGNEIEARNRVIGISLGYRIPFGGK